MSRAAIRKRKAAVAHSPGPWRLSIDRKYRNHQLYDADGESLACFDEAEEGPVALADARLAVISPDLLAELRELVSMFNQDKVRFTENANLPQRQILRRVRALIAKAPQGSAR